MGKMKDLSFSFFHFYQESFIFPGKSFIFFSFFINNLSFFRKIFHFFSFSFCSFYPFPGGPMDGPGPERKRDAHRRTFY